MEKPWEFDDFIFDGDVLKGMTRKGKDKIKENGYFDMVVPTEGPDGTKIRVIGEQCFFRRKLNSVVIPETVEEIKYEAFGVNNLTEVIIPDAVKMCQLELKNLTIELSKKILL